MNNKLKYFDYFIFLIVLLLLVGSISYFFELINSNKSFGYIHREYNSNNGIIVINSFEAILQTAFVTIFLICAFSKKGLTPFAKTSLILSGFALGLLIWIELWYGSTFYYGEVRDKQGLHFPITTVFLFSYPFWKIEFSNIEKRNFVTRIAITIIIGIALTIFYSFVEGPWRLWQS